VVDGRHLLLIGASTRAAAFSALRAGLRPSCADLFADADLRACCPVVRIPADHYPHGFLDLFGQTGDGPWLYTGALENWPALVRGLARRRPLWGNDEQALACCRSPLRLAALLASAGLPHPAVYLRPEDVPAVGRWLVKPRAGAAGAGIHFRGGPPTRKPRRKEVYYQEHIDGEPCAAVYVGDGGGARLLGVTRQLIGVDWLHAGPFRYGGSAGPLPLEPALRQALERLGDVLTVGCQLRGLFGVDFILRDGVPWPVEVNPRYTASVEVLEYALGLSALDRHRQVFEKRGRSSFPQSFFLPSPPKRGRGVGGEGVRAPGEGAGVLQATSEPPHPRPRGPPGGARGEREEPPHLRPLAPEAGARGEKTKELRPFFVGKAILSARAPLTFPPDGPWQAVLRSPPPPWQLPAFADIPSPGEPVRAGQPVLTFFAAADTLAACVARLQETALDLDRRLFLR
jgi:predicted ATP-grasp superfamily ATP-dependent carboligase